MSYIFIVVLIVQIMLSSVELLGQIHIITLIDLANKMTIAPNLIIHIIEDTLSHLKTISKYTFHCFFAFLQNVLQLSFGEGGIPGTGFVYDVF